MEPSRAAPSTNYPIINSRFPLFNSLFTTNLDPKLSEEVRKEAEAALKRPHFTILTWNVLTHEWDRKATSELQKWHERGPRIVAAMKEVGAKLIALQECYGPMMKFFIDNLGDKYNFAVRKTSGEGKDVFKSTDEIDDEQNPIFYDKEVFDRIHNYTIEPIVRCADKLFLCIELVHKASHIHFIAINVHFSIKEKERTEQVQALMKLVEGLVRRYPVIVMGDFNAFPNIPSQTKFPAYDGDRIMAKLTSNSLLKDTRNTALLGHIGPPSTYTNDPRDKIPFTGDGTPEVMLLRALVSNKVISLAHIINNPLVGGVQPSDHKYVAAHVALVAKISK
jgi:endonuclease/exonuclease/phosphatase family metal-dependent hydrolase